MSEYITEKDYVIAEGEFHGLYIFLSSKQNNPENPVIIYDGKDHAVFIRNQSQKVILDYINPQIREKLRQATEVTIIESLVDNVTDCYSVRMQKVDKIPVDWNKIGLKTWEEASLGA